jgi:hypothetical protein
MKIILTKKESMDYFYNALCNGLDYISAYDLGIKYDVDEYVKAKRKLTLKLKTPCFEDILIEILKSGGSLSLYDFESEEHNRIKSKDVYERVQKTQTYHLMNMINENDDAVTADVILQTVFLGEVYFG